MSITTRKAPNPRYTIVMELILQLFLPGNSVN